MAEAEQQLGELSQEVQQYRDLNERYRQISEENRQLYNTVQVRGRTGSSSASSCTRLIGHACCMACLLNCIAGPFCFHRTCAAASACSAACGRAGARATAQPAWWRCVAPWLAGRCWRGPLGAQIGGLPGPAPNDGWNDCSCETA